MKEKVAVPSKGRGVSAQQLVAEFGGASPCYAMSMARMNGFERIVSTMALQQIQPRSFSLRMRFEVTV